MTLTWPTNVAESLGHPVALAGVKGPLRMIKPLRNVRNSGAALFGALVCLTGGTVHAQEDQLHPSLPQPSVASSLPEPLRSLGGLRPWLYPTFPK